MEEIVTIVTLNISYLAEILAAFVITGALLVLSYQMLFRKRIQLECVRLQFGRSVALSLEMLLAADVLQTAIAPGWKEIGQLAAIVVIRTLLNYFLEKELAKTNRSLGQLTDR